MGRMVYKNRPGGYTTMPVAITKSQKLTMEEKFVLCFIMGYWMNKSDSLFYFGYISTSLCIDEETLKSVINRLVSLGFMKVSSKKHTSSGDMSFSVSFDVDAVNSFFGCELIGPSDSCGKTSPVVQPVRKQITKLEPPLAWMESDYYKNREQGCRR